MTDDDVNIELEDNERETASKSKTARLGKGRGVQGDKDRYGKSGNYESIKDDDDESGPAKSIEGYIIFVSGVHQEAEEEDIRDKFAEYGPVKNIQLPLDRHTGYVKGYCLIEYENKKEGEAAIGAMNGAKFMDKKISVGWAFGKKPFSSRKKE